jgi:predicted metal-dependent hydrolase
MHATITEKSEFKERVRDWAERLGSRVTSITVRPMTNKWASYSTAGRLTFDASLLELPDQLQDYVIAHELLHFHAPNHGKLWKSLMRAHLGEYEQLEVQLKRVVKNRAIGSQGPDPARLGARGR